MMRWGTLNQIIVRYQIMELGEKYGSIEGRRAITNSDSEIDEARK